MITLIGLWSITLLLGGYLYCEVAIKPVKDLKSRFKVKDSNSPRLNRWLNHTWLKPGWFVDKLTKPESIEKDLKLSNQSLTTKQFCHLKQLIWLMFVIYFWLYIWFGSVSWANSFKLFSLFCLSFYLPDLWLRVQKERHLKQLNDEVPYFIDLLSLTLQAGLNIEQALTHVVTHKKGLIAATVNQALLSLKLGRSLEAVLGELKDTVPNPDFQHFITSILRSKKLGVSLSNTLEIQSQLIRTKRRQRAEEISRTAAVKISLPLVLFIFPALLIIYLGPGLLNLMQQT